MLVWFAETTLVATVLAALALLASRWLGLRPVARHALWLAVLVKLVAPPIVSWPSDSPLAWASHALAPEMTGPGPSSVDVHAPSPPVFGADAPAWPAVGHAPSSRLRLPDPALVGRCLLGVWAVATAALALWQLGRVARFRRRFRWAVPAPGWLADEAREIGRRMGVHAPEILVLPGPMTPTLWFLGRPKLLVPGRLVETLAVVAWRGILAHELAHLLRRDHWVRRLEVAAGLLWWWSPLYWLTRRRIDAEAELACDEWAVRAFPGGRLAYAEALLEICGSLSTAEPRGPALGVAGAGRFLERRVTMILREQSPSRGSTAALLGAGLLALLALPGWAAPASSAEKTGDAAASAPSPSSTAAGLVADDDPEEAKAADDDLKRAAETDRKRLADKLDAERVRERGKRLADKLDAEGAIDRGKRLADKLDADAARDRGKRLADKLDADAARDRGKRLFDKLDAEGARQRGKRLADKLDAEGARNRAKRAVGKLDVSRESHTATDGKPGKRREKSVGVSDAARGDRREKPPTDGSEKERASKARRIRELESQIEKLNKELESLKADSARP